MCFPSVLFGIMNAKMLYQFKPTETHVGGNVEAMFNTLKADSRISETDIKERRLSLRVYAYETQSVQRYKSCRSPY